MKQKRSLSEALQVVASRQQGGVINAAVMLGTSRRVERVAEAPDEPRALTPARVGKRLVGGHFDKAVSRQLREIAAREDTTVQALLAEAMNMLFVARGLPEIAER